MRAPRFPAVALLLFLAPGSARAGEPAPIAFLSALAAESQPVAAALADRRDVMARGLPCIAGRLAGRPVLVASTGVGKVNASMSTTLLIERFSPAAVIFSGVAQVCHQLGVPFLVVRGLSDRAGADARAEARRNLDLAARNAAQAALAVGRRLLAEGP